MPPKIKIFRVPQQFEGIDNVTEMQSLSVPDIIQDTTLLFPIERATSSNTGNPGLYEEDPKYKNPLTKIGNTYFSLDHEAESWVFNHLGLEPRVYVKAPQNYINSVWEYTYVPKYDADYALNYTFVSSSGVQVSSKFMENNPEISGGPYFASFYLWKPTTYQHPTSSDARGWFAAPSGDYVDFAPRIIEINEGGWHALSSGTFNTDSGYLDWQAAPSGSQMRVTGYRHLWERITGDDLHDMQFNPGEVSPSGISSNSFLVKDFTPSGPWYLYSDFKVVNESTDGLEKVFIKEQLRGNLSNGSIIEGWDGLENTSRPWDQQQGGAVETCGYQGNYAGTANVSALLVWQHEYCFASGVPLASGVGFRHSLRFPAPLSGVDLPQIFSFYDSTQRTPSDKYAFSLSSHNVVDQPNSYYRIRQAPQNGEFMILSGQFGHTGFPIPGTIYGRAIYTLRNFDVNAHDWSTSPIFNSVNESEGPKYWTLEISGDYYS